MNGEGRGREKILQKMKTSLEREPVQYNQLWHKYWMNANKECRVDVKKEWATETPESPAFHTTHS